MAKRKNAQQKILNEINNQLLIKAKVLGIDHLFTPVRLEDMRLQASRKIMGDLLAEKSNLEYEMNITGDQNRDSRIKLEKIEAYIRKCARVIEEHERNIERMIGKHVSDPKKTKTALKKFDLTTAISTTR